MYIVLAVLSGALTVLSRTINARLGQHVGIYKSTLLNYITGLLLSLVILLCVAEPWVGFGAPQNFAQVLMYFGGFLGVATVMLSNIVAPKLSAFVMTLLVFISQMATGVLIDYFFYGIFSKGQLLGCGIMVVGLILYQRPSKQTQAVPQ